MTIDPFAFALALAGAAVIGMWAGLCSASSKWARNADAIWRIEYNGRLFKVLHDEDYTTDVMNVVEENKRARKFAKREGKKS